MIFGTTKLLGLMGRPVGHSLSPAMHNAAFAEENLDFVYVAMDVDPDELPAAVRGAVALGFRGFNLTMPHKEKIIALLDDLDGAAEVSGAVNTVVISGEKLYGHNTDGSGMVAACREAGASISGKRVFILGAGGAASAIAFALLEEGASELGVFNRNVRRAEKLAAKLEVFDGTARVFSSPLESLESYDETPDVLINTTSLGMEDGDPLPVPDGFLEALPEHAAVADAVYRSGERTPLLRAADEIGLKTISGRRMLLFQGVHAQKLWTGREPNVRAMDEGMKRSREAKA